MSAHSSFASLLLLAPLALNVVSAAESPSADAPTIAAGPFRPTWESLDAYECPEWFRDAKFGIWSHWGPQAVPEVGDWYARNLYIEGHPQNKHHVATYGHPSAFGYKDIIPLWKAEKFDPEALMEKYARAGAKYFVSMGVHHDNFDLWNSRHHRWNAVNMGPHRDIVGEWAAAARKRGLRFGVSEHLERTYSWFQTNKGADKTGPLAGVPYDGNDPKNIDLYLPAHGDTRMVYPLAPSPEWQRHWFDRVVDLVDQHRPDLVYTDGGVPFGDIGRAFMAHYYNRSLEWNGGRLEAVYNIKDHGDDHGEYREGVAVQDLERRVLQGVKPAAWQTCSSVADWFYSKHHPYKSATEVVHMLADIVSKNGNLLLNFTQRPDGSLDPQSEKILEELAAWMPVNGEAIFGTRPWTKFGEGPSAAASARGNFVEGRAKYSAADVRFTTKPGFLYAILLGWPGDGARVTLSSLATGSDDVGSRRVRGVELLGAGPAAFVRDDSGLHVEMPAAAPTAHAVVLKIALAADPAPAAAARANLERRVVLRPEDVRALPDAPAGFDTPRASAPAGRIELLEYDSAVTGARRRATVYLPPGYTADRRLPVLYLLHGIGGDETEWMRFAAPNVILDNLLADGKAAPMIVVMPNGRALPDDRAVGDPFAPERAAGFAKFERDLLDHLVPAVEAKYAVRADRGHRALAGLSMGGGQALNFGLSHLDTFAWIGAFSPAPNTRPPAELIPDPATLAAKLRLLYLSCGNRDGLMNVAQGVQARLREHGVPHVWNVDDFGHDSPEWRNNFHHFAQRLFR